MACPLVPTLDHVIQRPARAGTFGGCPFGQHLAAFPQLFNNFQMKTHVLTVERSKRITKGT